MGFHPSEAVASCVARDAFSLLASPARARTLWSLREGTACASGKDEMESRMDSATLSRKTGVFRCGGGS